MYNNDNWTTHGGLKGWGNGYRTRRGDMRPIILAMLKTNPMHGYEIISKLEEKSYGMWRPSAGSVYPNLQLLEDQDLVTSTEQGGKKIYSLTEDGKKEAEHAGEEIKRVWEHKTAHAKKFMELKVDLSKSMDLIHQIMMQDSEEKTLQLKALIKATNDKLETLLK